MASWDPTRAKGQLRLTAQRLAQQRDRTDAQGNVVSRDIATLLGQHATLLARAKAQRLIRDEILGDMLEHLEMHLGVLSERIAELDSHTPSPPVVEAAATVIYAAPYINLKDLDAVRDLLGVCLGSEFLQAASTNRDQLVSSKVIRALSAPPPSAAELDTYLLGIAKTYKVEWEPELRTDDVLRALSEILDKNSVAPTIDMPRLRRVCAHGIPSSPPFLRPRTWKLLLGTLPNLKANWDKEAMKARANYYELVRRLLTPFVDLPSPTDPPDTLDAALITATKDLFRVPHGLFADLESAPEPFPDCPLDPTAPTETRIAFANVLDARLDAIHGRRDVDSDAPAAGMPSISLTTPDGAPAAEEPTTVAERAFSTGGAHPHHAAALVRLLYIHSALNPAHRAPHLASLLIPLYSVLLHEVEAADLAHAEADAFWLFEALVGEFAELEDEEGGGKWMGRFGERVQWADADLAADLAAYEGAFSEFASLLIASCSRWLAPLLTHTLPLPAVLVVWDAIFSRPTTTRDASPKLDYLLDVCTAMLLRARGPISRLGKSGHRSPGLWGDENGYPEPPSPVRAWELNDAFIEGMAILQLYPVEAAGGVESILQTAADLAARREDEAMRMQKAAAAPNTLGARLRDTVWRGFTNQVGEVAESPDTSDEEEEEETSGESGEGHETDRANGKPPGGIAAALTNTLWKGFSNQAAMEPPPTPIAPPSPIAAPSSPTSSTSSRSATRADNSATSTTASIWSYAEKLRDSDTAASLARASTNWRVKAMQAWTTRTPAPAAPTPSNRRSESVSISGSVKYAADDPRRESLPPRDPRGVYSPPLRPTHSPPATYSPPARPAFFRPPRDSWMPQPRRSPLSSPTTPDITEEESTQRVGRAAALRDSLASLTAFASSAPKPPPSPAPEKRAGPRPLLLNSASLMTAPVPGHSRTPSRGPSRAPSRSPRPSQDHFVEHVRQDSMQSVSSISDILGRPASHTSDAESDTTDSRVVKLNRSSISPLALAARHARMSSVSPGVGAASSGSPSQPVPTPPSRTSSRGWALADAPPDSPATLPASPPPHTPPSSTTLHNVVTVADSDTTPVRVLEPPSAAQRKLSRKKTPPPPSPGEETSDSPDEPPRSPRALRSKRLAQLNISREAMLQQGVVARSPSTMSPASAAPLASPGATLAPPAPQWEEHETAPTPRAASFPSSSPTNGHSQEDSDRAATPSPVSPRPRVRKVSGEGGTRIRKLSSTRGRKVSDTRPGSIARESGAEEGDDEGYDDLLSAYESEDSVSHH